MWSYGKVKKYYIVTKTTSAMDTVTLESLPDKTFEEPGLTSEQFKKGTKGFWIISNQK